MKLKAGADRVTVGERMENLAQTVTSVGPGGIGDAHAHLAVMARTAEADEPVMDCGVRCVARGTYDSYQGADVTTQAAALVYDVELATFPYAERGYLLRVG